MYQIETCADIGDIRVTQHLLLECLDIRTILELGLRVEDVSQRQATLRQICYI